jgi:hypothetical protein
MDKRKKGEGENREGAQRRIRGREKGERGRGKTTEGTEFTEKFLHPMFAVCSAVKFPVFLPFFQKKTPVH